MNQKEIKHTPLYWRKYAGVATAKGTCALLETKKIKKIKHNT